MAFWFKTADNLKYQYAAFTPRVNNVLRLSRMDQGEEICAAKNFVRHNIVAVEKLTVF